MVTTLDTVSKGRALLGIGAAWNEDEYRGHGFDFPPNGERMNRLDEAQTIARLMFMQEPHRCRRRPVEDHHASQGFRPAAAPWASPPPPAP